jgi:cytochrome c biogenesis protein
MAEKSPNPIWDTLSSIRITLILLIILAITSIFGTLIPQQEESIKFAQGLSPGLAQMLSSLQVFDMYHSVWFRLIIFLLSVNLIVCSIERFPVTLKLFRLTPSPDRSKVFEEAAPRTILLTNAAVEETSSRLQEYLRGRFNNLIVKESGNTAFIYCDKRRFSLFFVYLVHLSVLFILIGAIIGSIFGFNAYVNIPEGGSIDSVVITNGDLHSHKELGFSVQCNKFLVDYYDNGVPKEYRSDLSFIVKGKESLRGNLLVNHPIKFMGVTFYQSSYGAVPGNKIRIKAINDDKGAEETMIEAEVGKSVMLPDNKGELTVSNIRDEMSAALIVIKSQGGEETPIWLFKNRDMMMKMAPDMFKQSAKFNPSIYRPYTFSLDEIESVAYTGLQVNRDPGVQLVFIGFIMIITGLFFTFFTSHRKFWIRVTAEKGDVKISLAGMSSKNPVAMEREIDRLLLRLKKVSLEGRHNG